MAALIDEYSLTAVPLEMTFRETHLSTGTGFIWENESQLFLVTNWHNVTGINPRTGEHLSKNAGEPDGIVMLLHAEDYRLEKSVQARIPLRVRKESRFGLNIHWLGKSTLLRCRYL
jgi:hypothetical protein